MPRSIREYVRVGEVHGRFTIVSVTIENSRQAANVRCSCGNIKHVDARTIALGMSLSCGCLRSELTRIRTSKPYKREHSAWRTMVQRCHNRKNVSFERYGSRGIFVCDEWRLSFDRFIADMGPRPTPAHSIERIDNDGPYCKANCRWATRIEQAANRRNTATVIYNGHLCNVADLARVFGIELSTLHWRIESGLDVETALTLPVSRERPRASLQSAR